MNGQLIDVCSILIELKESSGICGNSQRVNNNNSTDLSITGSCL